MGRYRGALSGVRPDDLAAATIRAAVGRSGIDPAEVHDVFWGAANQAGEDNRDVARMAALLAGLPVEVPGMRRREARYGIAALCVGVGQGLATVLERVE